MSEADAGAVSEAVYTQGRVTSQALSEWAAANAKGPCLAHLPQLVAELSSGGDTFDYVDWQRALHSAVLGEMVSAFIV